VSDQIWDRAFVSHWAGALAGNGVSLTELG
jgi:hypothetical protein